MAEAGGGRGGGGGGGGRGDNTTSPPDERRKAPKTRSHVWEKVMWFMRRSRSGSTNRDDTDASTSSCEPDADSVDSSSRSVQSSSRHTLAYSANNDTQAGGSLSPSIVLNCHSEIDSQPCVKPSIVKALYSHFDRRASQNFVIPRKSSESSSTSSESGCDLGTEWQFNRGQPLKNLTASLKEDPLPTDRTLSRSNKVCLQCQNCTPAVGPSNYNSWPEKNYPSVCRKISETRHAGTKHEPVFSCCWCSISPEVVTTTTTTKPPSNPSLDPLPTRPCTLPAKPNWCQQHGNCLRKPDQSYRISSGTLGGPTLGDKCDTTRVTKGDDVDGRTFKHRLENLIGWFGEFNDQQKNMMLKKILEECGLPQMHYLSVAMEPILHQTCPHNCQDILAWLPTNISSHILSLLDPVSLSNCSQVSRSWNFLANEPMLWRNLCLKTKWRLSRAGEQKQMIKHMNSGGVIDWKQVFAERYRLRLNWLRGRYLVRTFEGHTQGISCVQFDDTRIVSGSSDKTIKVWNIRANTPWAVLTLVGHSGTVRCLHMEGNRLVSGSTDRTIKVWDLSMQSDWSSIACRVTMTGHTDTVRCLQVDDERVVSGSYDKTLKVWCIRSGECLKTLKGHTAAVLCVQVNDNNIVSGSVDKTIKLWSLSTGDCMMTLEGHEDAVTCLQFDCTKIVSGSLDSNLMFWDFQTGLRLSTLDWTKSEGHTGVVRCLQADNWRIVSAADDKTLKVWNLETGERLVTLREHTDGVTCLQFNDSKIVSGSYDKTVKLWDFS